MRLSCGLAGCGGLAIGSVGALHLQRASLMAQLKAIGTSIRVFRPAIDLGDLPAKIQPAPFTAFRGEFQRLLSTRCERLDDPWIRWN